MPEGTLEARRGTELFPFGPKRLLEAETEPEQAGVIQDDCHSGGMPHSKSRRCHESSLIGFEVDSGDDYDELGAPGTEENYDVVYQGMDSVGPRNFG